MKKTTALGLCLYLILSVPAMARQQKPLPLGDLDISADSLGSMVLGQSIELMLHDGTYVAGKVIKASREDITVNVKKCEPKGRVTGSNAIMQTADISMVYMKKSGNVAAPVALGIVGGGLGFVGGVYVGYRMDSVPAAWTFGLAAATGGAAAGAIGGREAVRKKVAIAVTAPSK